MKDLFLFIGVGLLVWLIFEFWKFKGSLLVAQKQQIQNEIQPIHDELRGIKEGLQEALINSSESKQGA